MIPRVRIDEAEAVRKWARSTGHPFFEENLPILEDLFLSSLAQGATPSLALQFNLLRFLLSIEAARRRYRRYKERFGKALRGLTENGASLDRVKRAQSLMNDAEQGELSARALEQRLRSIGDGIAWRLLSYDRTVLRLLAEHAPLSTPQLDSGLEAELIELIGLTQEQGMRCLLNAITNFLRVGDITAINPQTGAVTIREVKSGTTTTARTRRQSDYLMVVQEGIDSGIHPLGQMKLRRIVSEKPLKTHVRSIERALQEADQKLGASRVFGDYLAVAVVSQRLFETAPEEKWSGFSDPHFRRLGNVRRGSADFLLRMDNVIPFTHFSPNVAPYAVFPIDPGLRFGFMTGRYLVLSVLNVSGLARWLERRGLQTEILVPEEEIPPEDAFPDLPVLTVSSGQMTMQVGLTLLATASMEFWMRESIEEIIRVTMATGPASASQDEGYTHVVFPNTGKHAWD